MIDGIRLDAGGALFGYCFDDSALSTWPASVCISIPMCSCFCSVVLMSLIAPV